MEDIHTENAEAKNHGDLSAVISEEPSFYRVLELDESASTEDIKSAWKRLSTVRILWMAPHPYFPAEAILSALLTLFDLR